MPVNPSPVSETVRELDEIITRPPNALLRWGITVLFLLLTGLLTGTWFIRYPEVITGSVVITTRRPSVRVISRTSGKLARLLVNDTSTIRQGALLAEIENTTHLENVPRLHRLTNQVLLYLRHPGSRVEIPDPRLTFGDLHAEVVLLLKQFDEYQRLQNDRYPEQQRYVLTQQINDLKRLIVVTQTQAAINSQEFANTEQKYLADKKLYDEKVYGRLEFLKEENSYLQKKKEIESYRRTAIENSLALSDREKQRQTLTHDIQEKRKVLESSIRLAVSTISNTLKNWQQNYLITAPITGRIRYLKELTPNQYVRTNDTLFTVSPQNEPLLGFVTFPVQGMGKVRIGQRVIIRLDNYPYQEFGTVPAVVSQLLPSTSRKQYRAIVTLPKGLGPLRQFSSGSQPEMTGTADLVTDDIRLLERLFNGFRKLIQ